METIDERVLYDTNRDRWLEYVSPNMARKLVDESGDTLGATWARIPRDYQTAVWQHFDDAQRARIRKLRGNTR